MISEVIFIEQGIIDIGFEVTRKPRWVLRLGTGSLIGAYYCCENVNTLFVTRCRTDVHGFYMRKHTWLELLDDFEEIGSFLREKVRIQYHAKVRGKVIAEKERFLKKLNKDSG